MTELEKKLQFRDKFIYERRDVFFKIIEEYKIQEVLFDKMYLRINFNHKKNQHITLELQDQIINELLEINFVDNLVTDKRFVYVNHSSDIKEELIKFYS